MKNRSGLTLIEIIIASLLFSIMLAAIFSLLAVSRKTWDTNESQLVVQQEVRRGLSEMVKELRQLRLSSITGVPNDGTPYPSITFQIPETISESGTTWSSNIQYSLGGLGNSQILRTKDASQRVLANNISNLSFTRNALTPDVINISLTCQKNTFPGFSSIQSSLTLNTEVKARN